MNAVCAMILCLQYPPPEPLDYLLLATADHHPGQSASAEIMHDDSIIMGTAEQKSAGSRTSPAAAQPSVAAVSNVDDDSRGQPSSSQKNHSRSVVEIDDSALVISQCWPSPSQESRTRSVTDSDDSMLEVPKHPSSQGGAAACVTDVSSDDDDVIFVSESTKPQGSSTVVVSSGDISVSMPSQCPSLRCSSPRLFHTTVRMSGIKDCHQPACSPRPLLLDFYGGGGGFYPHLQGFGVGGGSFIPPPTLFKIHLFIF